VFRRRVISIFLVLAAFGALCTVSPWASAQDLAGRKQELDQRKAELDREIGSYDRTIAEADQQVAQSTEALNRAAVQLELVADSYARTVDDRREPARTRVEIAIDAYMRGDPRITSLIEDLINLENKSDELLQREMYRAIVEDADNRLATIDERLRALGTEAQAKQAQTQSLRDQLAAAQENKRVATESRDRLAAERAAVVREIDDIISRANRAPLTGIPGFNDPNRPALVVKIDNVEAARPPIGVNNADVVFEEEVEAGLTRLAAVFHSRDANPVGPVRSVRSTDVKLLQMLNKPLFASSGGNPGVREELANSPLVEVGHSEFPDQYERNSRRAPHNLITTTSGLRQAAAGQGGSPPALFSYRSPGNKPSTAVPAGGVNVNFQSVGVSYEWTGSGWARSQRGSAHVDANGARIAPTNVIVQFTEYGQSEADETSPDAITVGNGDAWVFTEGSLVRGRWSRKNLTSPTVFSDEAGNPIGLLPGTTWVELARPGTASLR
jgi:hypothetical protein